MTRTVRRHLRDESGATTAEYALLLAIIGVGATLAVAAMGDSVRDSLNLSSFIIANAGSADTPAEAGRNAGLAGGGMSPDQNGATSAGGPGSTANQNGCIPGQGGAPGKKK